jgi:hypothetical protein
MAHKKGKERADFDNKFKEVVPISGLKDVVARNPGL